MAMGRNTAMAMVPRISSYLRSVASAFLACTVLCYAQDRRHIPFSIEDVMRGQTAGVKDKNSVDLNERLRSMTAIARFSQDYLLGPGDIILITVYGIEDLKQKELTLDSGGWVTLPFIRDV